MEGKHPETKTLKLLAVGFGNPALPEDVYLFFNKLRFFCSQHFCAARIASHMTNIGLPTVTQLYAPRHRDQVQLYADNR
jgi:hypothetical protein